jgi:hypothetical protein
MSLLAWGALGLGVVGCAPKKAQVTGQVTQGATPIRGKEHERLTVVFIPLEGSKRNKGLVYEATVDQEEGTYEIVVPLGQYRVCITQPTVNLTDKFGNAFGQRLSPIVRDVTGDAVIDIDLDKPNPEASPDE